MFLLSRCAVLIAGLLVMPAWAADTADYAKPPPGTKVIAVRAVVPLAAPVGTLNGVVPFVRQKDAPYIVLTRPIPGSRKTYDLYLVQTRDEIMAPMALRKPAGDGPFPVILLGSGGGGGSFVRLDAAMHDLEPMMDEIVGRGYAVAYGNTRTMVVNGFNRFEERAARVPDTMNGGGEVMNSSPALDSDDFVSFIQHLKALPFVNAEAVTSVGIGRSGELAAEAATVVAWKVAVSSEAPNWELLRLNLDAAPRQGHTLDASETHMDRIAALADKDAAVARLKRIKTPIIHMGRPPAPMSGLYRLAFEWHREAGGDAQWGGFNNHRAGYIFPRRTRDGAFVDHLELQAFWDWMGELDKRLGRSEAP
jgi:hypothetical protein